MTCSTNSYDEIFNIAAPELPGAEPKHILQVIDRVVVEFCSRSLFWQEKLTPSVRTNGSITLASPNGEVMWILSIAMNDLPVQRYAPYYPVVSYEPVSPTEFKMHNLPEGFQKGDLVVTCALRPNSSKQVPDTLYTHYMEAMRTGVTGYMMNEPFKPYMSLETAATNLALYRKYTAEAKDISLRGHIRAELEWSYPRSFV